MHGSSDQHQQKTPSGSAAETVSSLFLSDAQVASASCTDNVMSAVGCDTEDLVLFSLDSKKIPVLFLHF
jgi:hypothetical protein